MGMALTVQPLTVTAVEFNREEMAAAIAAINERYAGLVVTDKAEAKKDRAAVNKLLRQIDEARKQVKAQYEAPLKAFEAEIKGLVEPLKQSAAAIDEQIKAIEETERQERRSQLEAAFSPTALLWGINFDWVLEQRWLNASVSLKKATEEMNAKAERMITDLTAIEGLKSPNYPALVQRYFEGVTLADVLAYDAKLRQTAQTFTIAAEPTVDEVAAELAAADLRNDYIETDTGIQVTAKVAPHKLVVTCTERQWELLGEYLDRNGLFWVEQ